jgi:hypothetical protein
MFLKIRRFILISILFALGYFLVNYYRPYQIRFNFPDFGLADSGSGMISIIIVYLLLSRRRMDYSESRNLSVFIFSLYVFQELLSYFFPGFIGTFDWKDLLYYFFGFLIVYFFYVKDRKPSQVGK